MLSTEDVLIAILHCVGSKRLKEDRKLYALFGKAAEDEPVLLGRFATHPQYGDSPRLSEALGVLRLGGSIEYVGDDGFFMSTPAILGQPGQEAFESLYPQDKAAVEYLAYQIRELRQ